MKANNFWGISRLSDIKVGMIVRLGLVLLVAIGSLALTWTLLSSNKSVHASGIIETPTLQKPNGVAFDTNGHIWVAEPGCTAQPVCTTVATGAIGEFNLSDASKVKEFSAPSTYMPVFLAVDGSGNVWSTDPTNNAIGELVPGTSTWTEFHSGISTGAEPYDLALDGAGNIWFTEQGANRIGYINSSSHTVQETTVGTTSTRPYGIIYDAVNNVVWFADQATPNIGSFTPTANGILGTGAVTMHPVLKRNYFPHLLALDKQHNVWFSEGFAGYIGELVHSSMTATDYSICPTQPCGDYIAGIGLDSNGTVWFNDSQFKSVGALNPTTDTVTWTAVPNSGNAFLRDGLGVDNANNIWFTDQHAFDLGKIPATNGPTPTPTTTPTSTPTPPPTGVGPVSPTWYFAEGKVGLGFTEFLTIQNPDPVNSCPVSIQYLLSSSTPTPKTITVPPNTRWTEGVNSDLNTPASSSSPQAVSTIVSVTNTSSCKGVVAERPIYFTNFKGMNSGTDVLGATHTGTDFSFADVSTLPGYNSYITILNPPGGSPASLIAYYYRGGIQLGTDTLTVQPGTRGTIIPKSFGQQVATRVLSTVPVVVERPTYFNNYSVGNAQHVSGAASVVGASAPAADWRFAEGYTGGQFQENLVLANFSTSSASGTLTLEYDNGSTLTAPISVHAQDESLIDVNAYTASHAGVCSPASCVLSQSVSAEITMSSGTIVAEREQFFHYTHYDRVTGLTTAAQGGTDVTGQAGSATASAYSFAEGYTNAGFDEWLTLQNPTATSETVWVRLVNGKSNSYQFAQVVGGHTRATVNLNEVVVQHLLHANDGVGGYEISMTVQTTDGSVFVAERPMYWNYHGTQGGSDIIGYIGG